MPRQIQGSQMDFSAGEVDVSLKRADEHPARQKGVRQMSNWRILHSGAVQNRPGRSALFPLAAGDVRTEEVAMSAGNNFKLVFGANKLKIVNSSGAVVQTFTTQGNGAALPWASSTDIQTIVYAIINLSIYITFGHSMRPQVVTWDGVSTWSIADYTEQIAGSGQKRTLFYRISPQGITLQPSATAGVVTVLASLPVFTAGWVGVRFRYVGRQLLVTGFTDSTHITAIVIEPLPPSQTLTVTNTVGSFTFGDVLLGATSGAKGVVTSNPKSQNVFFAGTITSTFLIGDAITGGTSGATGVVTGFIGLKNIIVSLSTGTLFQSGEVVTGPHGNATSTGVTGSGLIVQILPSDSGVATVFTATEVVAGPSGSATNTGVTAGSPQPVTVWDDEVINTLQGYPASVFADQFRLGFCDFPNSMQGFIAWSAINNPTDLYVGALSNEAIFVPAPDKIRVRYVVAGPESSEFVFGDRKNYYIPIDPSNPLTPSTVSFQNLSGDGTHGCQPKVAQEVIFYVSAGGASIMAITAPGMTNRPYNTRFISRFHSHLFSNVIALAAPNADGSFTERYIYALNSNGSIVVGKYAEKDIEQDSIVGWSPWSGGATVSWVSVLSSRVLFTSSYFGVPICEMLDDTQHLDAGLFVNNLPTAFTPPGGKGPLWWIPSQTVFLIDQGYRIMGVYQIDANGFIVPQNNGGENLAASTLVAGQAWTGILEPFSKDAASGPDMHQRMLKRGISYLAVYVVNSTGFALAKLFSSKQTPTSPPLGTVMNIRRVPPWNMGDDPTLPPTLRETVEDWRPSGFSYDPRVAVIKDTPGPLSVEEIAMEISI